MKQASKVAGVSEIVPPDEFRTALESLRDSQVDGALEVKEIPAPNRIAPWSAAVSIKSWATANDDRPLGSSTLVVLCDPHQRDAWGGTLRLIGHARIQIDPDQSTDPLLSEVVWQTLADCLDSAGASFHRMVGTVTRELSETFGGLDLRGSALNVDLRCSWSPATPYIGEHLEGWSDALRQNAGIAPSKVTLIGSSNA